MEKLKKIYYYINTKAYEANINIEVSQNICAAFKKEVKDLFGEMGFKNEGKLFRRGDECITAAGNNFHGNIKSESIEEIENALKSPHETFIYQKYNLYDDVYIMSEEEQQRHYSEYLAEFKNRIIEGFKGLYKQWHDPWMQRPFVFFYPCERQMYKDDDAIGLFESHIDDILDEMVSEKRLAKKTDKKGISIYKLFN